jgi:HTH-type transcriptional regulator/antitoxin HigA
MRLAIDPIRTEADYGAALARADALMDAEPGTLDGDYLDVLVRVIEAYEALQWPTPTAPSSTDEPQATKAKNPPAM